MGQSSKRCSVEIAIFINNECRIAGANIAFALHKVNCEYDVYVLG